MNEGATASSSVIFQKSSSLDSHLTEQNPQTSLAYLYDFEQTEADLLCAFHASGMEMLCIL